MDVRVKISPEQKPIYSTMLLETKQITSRPRRDDFETGASRTRDRPEDQIIPSLSSLTLHASEAAVVLRFATYRPLRKSDFPWTEQRSGLRSQCREAEVIPLKHVSSAVRAPSGDLDAVCPNTSQCLSEDDSAIQGDSTFSWKIPLLRRLLLR